MRLTVCGRLPTKRAGIRVIIDLPFGDNSPQATARDIARGSFSDALHIMSRGEFPKTTLDRAGAKEAALSSSRH
jgi:hypothetical protein